MPTPKLYLDSSVGAVNAITRLYDFVWPAAAAAWNLRWQVQGFNAARGAATVKELQDRFVRGSGISGANLHRACIESTWEQHQQIFAEIVLINLFAIYEHWIDAMLDELQFAQLTKGQRTLVRENLQFPTSGTVGAKPGIAQSLALLTNPGSAALSAELYPTASAAPKVHLADIHDMLLVYRYFKEVRNCLVHANRVAGHRAADAFLSLGLIPNTATFPVPRSASITAGAPVLADLRGAVAFGEVIRRIIFAIEAELIKSAAAEVLFLARWSLVHGRRVFFKADSAERHSQVCRLVRKLRFPPPGTLGQGGASTQLQNLLITNRLCAG